jgi:hypothetical protein
MLVICSRAGGLGNRLFVFAHFIANAIEFNYEVVNPGFFDYAKYFKKTCNDLLCRYPSRGSAGKNSKPAQILFYHLFYAVFKILERTKLFGKSIPVLDISSFDRESKSYDLSGKDFIRLQSNAQLILARGWLFRDYNNIIKHAEAIRNFFTPIDPYVSNISQLIAKARNDCDVLVGVHIRQGDYRIFANGKYFYHTADYCQFMKQIIEVFWNKKVKFIICSNVYQNEGFFKGLNYIMGSNHIVEDMYTFTKCDYLVGPPSTYTGWASFYGSVPIFTITALGQNLAIDSAEVWQG